VNVSSYRLIPSEVAGSYRTVPVARKLTLRNWVVDWRLWCRTLFSNIFELFITEIFLNILLLHSFLYFSFFQIITIKIFIIIVRFKHITNPYFKNRQIYRVKLKDLSHICRTSRKFVFKHNSFLQIGT
jgi:hypothetical protein